MAMRLAGLLVRVAAVPKLLEAPFFRAMVTGCVESPPVQVMVTAWPAVTVVKTEVNCRPLWAVAKLANAAAPRRRLFPKSILKDNSTKTGERYKT